MLVTDIEEFYGLKRTILNLESQIDRMQVEQSIADNTIINEQKAEIDDLKAVRVSVGIIYIYMCVCVSPEPVFTISLFSRLDRISIYSIALG
jgi:hypothetical protein